MKKIRLIVFLLFLVPYHSYSQSTNLVDSLLSILVKSKNDTTKVNLLNALSKQLIAKGEFEKGLTYTKDAVTLSLRLNFYKGLSAAYRNISLINYKQGQFKQAIEMGEAALKISENMDDQNGIAGICQNLGYYYETLGNYSVALKMQYRALKIHEKHKDQHGVASNLNNIAIIYSLLKQYPEALKHFAKAAEIFKSLGDPYINHPYNNMGWIYLELENYPAALEYRTKALKIRETIGDKYEIANSIESIGSIYLAQNKYKDALNQYEMAMNIRIEIGDKFGISSALSSIGTVYLRLKQYATAKSYFKKSLAMDIVSGSVYGMQLNYEALSTIDSATGNYKSAYENYKNSVLYRDSLLNEENIKHLVQNQMKYEFDKKETIAKAIQSIKDTNALKELKKQKRVRNSFILGFLIVLLFAAVFFNQRNHIKKGKKRSDELLLNILPAEVAEEIKTKGSADAKQFDEVTVMFTDFKDFTQISEKLTPSQLVAEIHYFFKAFDMIITRHNIEKIKTIGDSYMCAGGLPISNTTHAYDVIQAALEIQQLMLTEAQLRKNEGREIFEIRIGIHTGPVVAGIVGIKKFAYDIWGDTVNTASRMESAGEQGKVNISGSTYELVKDKFNFTYRGKIISKHKGELDMYFVKAKIDH